MGFLNQLFKHRESGESAPAASEPAVKLAENPFLHPKDPPARLQPPVIHAPSGLGSAARAMSASAAQPQLPAVMFLEMGDVLPRVPEQYVRRGSHDLRQLLRFDAKELALGMAKGRVEVPLPKIAEQSTQVFLVTAHVASDVMIRLPLQKLVDQMGDSSVYASRLQEEKTAPPVKGEQPPVQGEQPPVQGEQPPVFQEVLPVVQKVLPVVQEVSSVVQEVSPVVQGVSPVVQEVSPVVQEVSPVVQEVSPVVQEVSLVVQEEPPIVQDATPIPFAMEMPAAPRPHPSNLDLVAGPLLTPVHASVDTPLQATLRPFTLGSVVPQPEIPAVHAPASDTPFAPPPIRLVPIQPPQVRAAVFAAPPVAAVPNPVVDAAPKPQSELPEPESEPPSDPRTVVLQKIFLTDEVLDLPAIARHVATLPGVLACHISCDGKSAQGGTFPVGFDAAHLQALAPGLTASAGDAASQIRIGDVQNVTLHGEDRSVTIFSRASVVLAAVLGRRGFVPGVRERLTQVIEALSFS